MEGLKLGMREQQYYAELFQSCDVESSGKITGPKASELFLASGLSPDILIQITELCGAKRLGHFGRSQFYVALKLVALAQAGLPVKLDALNSGKDFPLPKFTSKGNEQVFNIGDRKKSCGEADTVGIESNKLNTQLSGQLPPPPVSKKSHSRSLSGQYRGVVPDALVIASSQSSNFSSSRGSVKDDSPHNSKSPPFSPTESPPISPANQKPVLVKKNAAPALAFASSLTNLSSCTASSQVQMVMTSSMDSADFTSHLINPSSLVGDIGHVNPVALSESSGVTGDSITCNSLGVIQTNHNESKHDVPQSQQLHSQENGIWTMFEDDEHHMLIGSGVKQYNTLEPPSFDTSSISSEAESVDDVWTITDEQREYYINQFKTMQPDLSAVITGPVAKHFFEKSKLPVVELSKIWQLSDLNCDGALSLEEFCIAMHLVVLRRNDIELPKHLPISLMPYSTLANDEPFAVDLPPGSTLKRATPPSPQQNIAKWTAFASESPDSGEVHSPAHLANFEFAKPNVDPELKIVQPVAVHVLPDMKPFDNDVCDRGRAFSVPVIRSHIQPSSGAGVEGQGGVTERPNECVTGQGHMHFPPTPPPRPPHARSMSVEVKSSSQLIAPAIPPRVSHKETGVPVAHSELLSDNDRTEDDDVIESSVKERQQPKSTLILRQCSRDSRDIHMALRTHRERNTMLTRLNSELNQELQEVMEQRIALEIQLEHLRPFSS